MIINDKPESFFYLIPQEKWFSQSSWLDYGRDDTSNKSNTAKSSKTSVSVSRLLIYSMRHASMIFVLELLWNVFMKYSNWFSSIRHNFHLVFRSSTVRIPIAERIVRAVVSIQVHRIACTKVLRIFILTFVSIIFRFCGEIELMWKEK